MQLNSQEKSSIFALMGATCDCNLSDFELNYSISQNQSNGYLDKNTISINDISRKSDHPALLFPHFNYSKIPHVYHYIAGGIALIAFMFGTIGNIASMIVFCR